MMVSLPTFLATCNWLNNHFPDTWIGHGGPIIWPPCSPDINPLDLFLWGSTKENVYAMLCLCFCLCDHLINCILVSVADIRGQPRQLVCVRDCIRHRCEACMKVGGGNFEQFL